MPESWGPSNSSLTVADNGNSPVAAIRYADATFARTNVSLLNGTNTFVAVAQDALGRVDTNTVAAYLPIAVTFAYDLNGNLRTNGTRIYGYDDENQLIATWVSGVSSNSFTYDGKMRRRVTQDYTWTGSAWVLSREVRYVYDGNLVVQERDRANVPQISYTRGKDLSGSLEGAGGIGGLLALSQVAGVGPQHTYYHADGNGNVTALLSTNQQVVARYLYDPFGNTLSASGPMADVNLYRFSSKEWHAASGLVYYLYRFYDPRLQRWPNRDPIGENGFESSRRRRVVLLGGGANRYAYLHNAPIGRSDPFGLDEYSDCQDRCVAFCSGPGIPSQDECLKNCDGNCDVDPNKPPSPIPPPPNVKRPKMPTGFWDSIKAIWTNGCKLWDAWKGAK